MGGKEAVGVTGNDPLLVEKGEKGEKGEVN